MSKAKTKNISVDIKKGCGQCINPMNFCRFCKVIANQPKGKRICPSAASQSKVKQDTTERTMTSWASFSSSSHRSRFDQCCCGNMVDGKNNLGACAVCHDKFCPDCVMSLCDYCHKMICSDCIQRNQNCIGHDNICDLCSSSSEEKIKQKMNTFEKVIISDCKKDIRSIKKKIKCHQSDLENLEFTLAKAKQKKKQVEFFMSYFPESTLPTQDSPVK